MSDAKCNGGNGTYFLAGLCDMLFLVLTQALLSTDAHIQLQAKPIIEQTKIMIV